MRHRREDTRSEPPRASLSHQPGVLYEASLERMREANLLLDMNCHVLSSYVAGLAVETLLQAHAIRAGSSHDARHDLRLWLAKCPYDLIDTVKQSAQEWSLVCSVWSNEMRYYSKNGLLGILRSKKEHRGDRGGPESILKNGARRCVEAARVVHAKGVMQW